MIIHVSDGVALVTDKKNLGWISRELGFTVKTLDRIKGELRVDRN